MDVRWIAALAFVLHPSCAPLEDSTSAPAQAGFGNPEDHRSAGLAASDNGFPGLASLCGEPSRALNLERVQSNVWRMPAPVPATRVFDNLYFVGNAFSSAWVVQTSEGLILIDALMNGQEVARDIEGGLASLGLDPADIRYLVVSHGHGDHSGGAAYLGGKYDLQVVMSRRDWEMSQNPDEGIQLPGWNDVPQPAILVEGEFNLTLGNTTITLVETPGHTMGTLSTLVPVKEGTELHEAVIWGGTGFNFGPKLEQYRAYAASAEAMRQRVLAEGIDVFLSNHVARDRTDERIEALGKRVEGDANPFVSPPETVAHAFEAFRECARFQGATLLQRQATN